MAHLLCNNGAMEKDLDVIQLEMIRTRLERAIQTGSRDDWYVILERTPQDLEFLLEKVRKLELTIYYLGKDIEKYKRLLKRDMKAQGKYKPGATIEDYMALMEQEKKQE